jgi:hypothetical protein
MQAEPEVVLRRTIAIQTPKLRTVLFPEMRSWNKAAIWWLGEKIDTGTLLPAASPNSVNSPTS